MFRLTIALAGTLALTAFGAQAGDFDAEAAHGSFVGPFNDRDWEAVKSVLTEDSVFHRGNGDQVYVGPNAIVERFSSTIGADDEWNVKFAKLDTTSMLTGEEGHVVERGDFAVTAGPDNDSCYAGSYMATWAPGDGGAWGLQLLSWQDVKVDMADCE